MATAPPDLTRAYDLALATAANTSVLQIRRTMRGITVDQVATAWPEFAAAITASVVTVQSQAVDLSRWYMGETLAKTTGAVATLPPTPVRVGTTVGGMSVARYVARTPEILAVRSSNGMNADDALAMSQNALVSLASTEPHRVARTTIASVTTQSELFVGWQRVPEAGACPFCLMLASRGGAYTSKQTASTTSKALRYHRNCRCTAVPVPKANAAAINQQAAALLNERPQRFGAASASRSEFEGTAALYRPGAGTPERLNSINLQISQIEQQLGQMTGDPIWDRPRQWNTKRLAELRDERSTFTL